MVDNIVVTHNGEEFSYSSTNGTGEWISVDGANPTTKEVGVALEKVAVESGVSPGLFSLVNSSDSANKISVKKPLSKIKIFE